MITVRPAGEQDLPEMVGLLKDAKLPREGVEEHFSTFLIAADTGSIVGGIGLEIYQDTALLRSAVVRPDVRNRGVGTQLYDAVLTLARQNNINKIVLLTTTAEKYFARKGFRRIDRSAVDGPVTRSIEFTSACPSSAICMELILDED